MAKDKFVGPSRLLCGLEIKVEPRVRRAAGGLYEPTICQLRHGQGSHWLGSADFPGRQVAVYIGVTGIY